MSVALNSASYCVFIFNVSAFKTKFFLLKPVKVGTSVSFPSRYSVHLNLILGSALVSKHFEVEWIPSKESLSVRTTKGRQFTRQLQNKNHTFLMKTVFRSLPYRRDLLFLQPNRKTELNISKQVSAKQNKKENLIHCF